MAIALPILVQLFAPLQGAVEWLAGGGPVTGGSATATATGSGSGSWSTRGPAGYSAPGLAPTGAAADPAAAGRVRSRIHARTPTVGKAARAWAGPTRAPERPLRVVRVLEARHPRSSAGRMVISGRMADVCAELDRLAALEGQPDRAAHA